jgi:uncharacterized heparinase superfamily protein
VHPAKPRDFSGTGLKARFAGWQHPLLSPQTLFSEDKLSALGVTHSLARASAWTQATENRLWLYHAHYFDDLCAIKADTRRAQHFDLLERWIEENPPGSRPGWEPYPSSRRIVNWLKWYLSGGELSQRAIDSLSAQADLLNRSLEFHLLGNHLLANLKALIFSGLLLDAPPFSRAWLRRGTNLLLNQLKEQILPDGGHHELSPMYHSVVLEDLLDLVNLCDATSPALAKALRPLCARMLNWLRIVSHPDGRIALFNDAAFDGCHSVSQLEAYADRLCAPRTPPVATGLVTLEYSGYSRLSMGPWVVIADAAPVGPDHLPGHAHADTLTFELSVAGYRVVVNSGTSTYEPNRSRFEERRTRAHNTIVVDEQDSSDTWGAFRVGRRARVFGVETAQSGEACSVRASHDGYVGVCGVTHTRCWTLSSGVLEILDELRGEGEHRLDWYLHLHPEVSISVLTPSRFELRRAQVSQRIRLNVDPRFSVRSFHAEYHPQFGVSLRNTCLLGTAHARLPCTFLSRFEVQ